MVFCEFGIVSCVRHLNARARISSAKPKARHAQTRHARVAFLALLPGSVLHGQPLFWQDAWFNSNSSYICRGYLMLPHARAAMNDNEQVMITIRCCIYWSSPRLLLPPPLLTHSLPARALSSDISTQRIEWFRPRNYSIADGCCCRPQSIDPTTDCSTTKELAHSLVRSHVSNYRASCYHKTTQSDADKNIPLTIRTNTIQ